MRANPLPRALLGLLAIAVACGSPDASNDPVQVNPVNRGDVKVEQFLAQEGCVKRVGPPRGGDIGLFTGGSEPERFTCSGVTGNRIRAAVQRHRETLQRGAEFAFNLEGYMIRHYSHSVRYCGSTTYSYYLGDVLLGTETVWDEGSCEWRHYYWDEWVPYGLGDEIPGGGGGGGGPFFSPDDSLHREPTIDTLPDYEDHTCDSWEYVTSSGGGTHKTVNFKCHKELDDTLKARIWDTLPQYLRPLNEIADTLARRECDSLSTWFSEVRTYDDDSTKVGLNVIWKGATDSISTGASHDGQSYGTRQTGGSPLPFHIDPKVYSKANTALGKKLLLQTVLHEIAHAWGYSDHSSTAYQTNYAGVPYFRTLHSGACIT